MKQHFQHKIIMSTPVFGVEGAGCDTTILQICSVAETNPLIGDCWLGSHFSHLHSFSGKVLTAMQPFSCILLFFILYQTRASLLHPLPQKPLRVSSSHP